VAFNTTINSSLLTTYLIRKFIPALEKDLQLQRFTTKAMVPAGEGKVARFNVFSGTGGNITALTEGSVTDGAITVTSTGKDVTIAEYGEFITLTRLADLASVKGSRDEVANRLGYQAALTIDKLVRNVAKGGTAFYAGPSNGAAPLTTTETLSARDVVNASLNKLASSDVAGLRGVAGHPDDEFACVVHPEPEADMITEAATSTNKLVWSEIVKHVAGAGAQEKLIKGYMGSVYGTACYRSQNIDQTTVTVGAYNNLVIGDGGLGAVSLEDMEPTLYVNMPSAGDVGNPYRNRSTIAWHVFFGTALIDSNRVVRLYSAK
jgi:N4-gp56 family major capsid protein